MNFNGHRCNYVVYSGSAVKLHFKTYRLLCTNDNFNNFDMLSIKL